MLTKTQLESLREHLERAQNPVFFYDNDADGFCSFVLLRRFLGRGKGVAVRTHPDLDVGYAKKAEELGADYVFVLDRPFLGEAFVTKIEEMGLPLVWVDHHDVESPHHTKKELHIFNPALSDRGRQSYEPVTSMAYRVSQIKEDMWIAIMGCISDHYLPDFSKDFAKDFPELWKKSIHEPFDAYFNSDIGHLARSISFGLKDSVSHVVYMQNFMVGCKTPKDMSVELESSSSFARKYKEIFSKYKVLLNKVDAPVDNVLFFSYGGDLSISSELANELSYNHKGKFVAVAYTNGSTTNLSIRGRRVRQIIEKILRDFDGARGGGHEDAVGVRLRTSDLERFKECFVKEVA